MQTPQPRAGERPVDAYPQIAEDLQAGRLDQAEQALHQLLIRHPREAFAHYQMGRCQRARGNLPAAIGAYRRAIALAPELAEAHTSLGNALRASGRLGEAIEAHTRAAQLQPRLPQAHLNLGNALFASGQPAAAARAYSQALSLQAGWDKARRGMLIAQAASYLGEGRWSDAEQAHRRLVGEFPDSAPLWIGLGIAAWQLGQAGAARQAFEEAWALDPHDGAACVHVATLLNQQGLWAEALPWHERVQSRLPGEPMLLIEQASALMFCAHYHQALECLERALAIDPECLPAAYHRAFVRLMLGDYAGGYRDFELRFTPGFVYPKGRPSFAVPAWQGEDLRGRSLLVWTEQGMGDALQFARYLPLLADRELSQLSVRVHGGLERLLQASFPQLDVASASVEPTLPAELECPLMSLPLLLGCSGERLADAVPYLHTPAQLAADWAKRLGPRQRPRIGLAWAGHPGQARNRVRSIPLALLVEFSAHFAGRCEFHVLQKGEGRRELDRLDAPQWLRSADACEDFADTAALIGALDLVITVDTSVAHLAGGLGQACWILLAQVPDWRYGAAGQQCGWYPQARLFRQDGAGDWAGVLVRLEAALDEWLLRA